MSTDTKILRDLLTATKLMLGNGRAWIVNSFNIQEILKSFLIIPEMARDFYIYVSGTPFPVSQVGVIPDSTLEKSLKEWENQFNIIPATSATINERAIAIESAWSARGSLGRGYLEKIIRDAGIPVRIRENIPAVDYSTELNSRVQYSGVEYNEFLPIGGNINYGGGSAAFLLGNGSLTSRAGSVGDIVNVPVNETQWQKLLIVEDEAPGDYAPLSASQYQLFLQLFLKYKPMEAVGYIRIAVS